MAIRLQAYDPLRLNTSSSRVARQEKIFLDVMRNSRGATTVATYSPRAESGAPVSVPLAWEELISVRGAQQFTVQNLRTRLAALDADSWEEMGDVRQQITSKIMQQLL